MNRRSLDDWLQQLESLHPAEIELGLERVGRVADTLELSRPAQTVITVAGTNGKGSTVAVLEALAQASGRSTGVFTSPHLSRFNERIRIDGREASDAEICAAFAEIDAARGETSLTYFEFAALAALWIFKHRAPDVWVLEVGLGGRLDAVNIVDANLAVITAIDLDHQGWLGDSRDDIAVEKAGILRPGVAAVIADPEPPGSLVQCIESIGVRPALFFGRDFGVQAENEAGDEWSGFVRAADGARRNLPPVAQGSLLPVNLCAALQAAELMGWRVADEALPGVLAAIEVPGRRQRRSAGGLNYLFDVAHNPAAVDKLLEYIGAMDCNKRKIALFSAMDDKDIAGMVGRAVGHFDAWFVADQPRNPRAARAEDVAACLCDAGQSLISCSKNLRQGLRRAQRVAGEGDTLVVFGSFSTVGEVMDLIEGDQVRHEAV